MSAGVTGDPTHLDFSPAPGEAPAGRRVWAHGLTEAKLLIRNGEQLLLALVIPIGLLVGGHLFGARLGMDQRTLAPSVFTLALWSTGFTSLAIATGFERRYGVLERLASTPLTRTGLLIGKAISLILIAVAQLVILAVIAVLLGWRPSLRPVADLIALIAIPLGVVAFACLGLLLAGTLRAEAVLGLANLIYLILLGGGAIVFPLAGYPSVLRPVVAALPTAALGEALRNASVGVTAWWPLLVLAAWALAGVLITRKVFRWMS